MRTSWGLARMRPNQFCVCSFIYLLYRSRLTRIFSLSKVRFALSSFKVPYQEPLSLALKGRDLSSLCLSRTTQLVDLRASSPAYLHR